MEHGRAFADAQEISHLPGRLAVHRAAQALDFAVGQYRPLRLQTLRHQQPHRGIHGVHGEQLHVGDHAGQFAWGSRQCLVAVHAEEEVPPLR